MLGPVSAWVGDRLLTGKPGSQAYSAWACRGRMSTRRSLGSEQAYLGSEQAYRVIHHIHRVIHHMVSQCSHQRTLRDHVDVGLACGDQRWLTGSGSTLEALRDDALYKSMTFHVLYFFILIKFEHYCRSNSITDLQNMVLKSLAIDKWDEWTSRGLWPVRKRQNYLSTVRICVTPFCCFKSNDFIASSISPKYKFSIT